MSTPVETVLLVSDEPWIPWELVKERDLGLVHFVGHGEHNAEDPAASGFHLQDGRTLRPRDLRRGLRRRLSENRPLVFLSACETGRQGCCRRAPVSWRSTPCVSAKPWSC